MKSEHRHELKTNELAAWLVNFPNWARENLKMIIYVSVVIILVAVSYAYKKYQTNVVTAGQQVSLTTTVSEIPQKKIQIIRGQAQDMDLSYSLLQSADNLQNIASSSKNDCMSAFAYLQRAELLRTELNYRLGTVSPQDRQIQLNRSKAAYNNVLETAVDNPSIKAKARLGLGLCEEELGNFSQAKQIYNEIAENPDFQSTVAAAQARFRLEIIDEYEKPVVFVAPPKPQMTQFQFDVPPDQLNSEALNGVNEISLLK
ncbi:MAG: tetratricopeptide repeat protein [Planctomycetota bacterium]|jgi:tetratricopeptide (TPR) repeat protein